MLEQQQETQQAEKEAQQAILAAAEVHAAQVRAEVTAPLIEDAHRDGTNYLTTVTEADHAAATHQATGRFKKRATARALDTATTAREMTRKVTRERWGIVPRTADTLPEWAHKAAARQAETNQRAADAARALEDAHTAANRLTARHLNERTQLREGIFRQTLPGRMHQGSVRTCRDRWRNRVTELRQHLTDIETLPTDGAVKLIRERQEAEEAAERARAQRQEQLGTPDNDLARRPGPQREQGYGL